MNLARIFTNNEVPWADSGLITARQAHQIHELAKSSCENDVQLIHMLSNRLLRPIDGLHWLTYAEAKEIIRQLGGINESENNNENNNEDNGKN